MHFYKRTMTDKRRQAALEHSLRKKARSICLDTSLDLSTMDKTSYLDDSGYTDLDSTPRPRPRPYRRIRQKTVNPRPRSYEIIVSDHHIVQMIHYAVVILVAASICLGVLVGKMDMDRTNMKYQAIQFGSERMGKGLVIIDKDTGELLGGKRAAIQFYHDKQSEELGLQI